MFNLTNQINKRKETIFEKMERELKAFKRNSCEWKEANEYLEWLKNFPDKVGEWERYKKAKGSKKFIVKLTETTKQRKRKKIKQNEEHN